MSSKDDDREVIREWESEEHGTGGREYDDGSYDLYRVEETEHGTKTTTYHYDSDDE